MNSTDSFLQSVMEQFNKTHDEAKKVLREYKKHKIVKFDACNGEIKLRHGAFWELDVINRAIAA